MKTIATTRPEVVSREEGITARAERLTEQKESGLQPPHVNFLAWLIPSALLAFLPKCPMCLAAYVAVATGIGISLPTATYVRATLLVLCIASLLYVLVRRLHRSAVLKEAILRMRTYFFRIQVEDIVL
ncbi:MAG TPA: hypothetical protein VIS99_13205 [Terrimicrobiaceae bacterium]